MVARDGSISAIEFEPWSTASGRPVGDRADDDPVLAAARGQLTGYFARTRTTFELPLAPAGTEFQLRVWEALLEVPHG
ncbi:MAG: methylated-DNA--[protein]-cysteine S-methyltransferase, partial [Nocardioidaceae bacterium]|nr:methylated-DNA--[protein]-cysteine S-methyltransferase [Nocardioidaceae bacterium]